MKIGVFSYILLLFKINLLRFMDFSRQYIWTFQQNKLLAFHAIFVL